MRIFKKEKRVVGLILQHIDKTGECVETATDAVGAFLSGDVDKAASSSETTNSLEADADALLRDIREQLYSGAYLPLIRGDIYRLMSAVDDVANKAEDCSDCIHFQKPRVAEEYRADILAIVSLTRDCFAEFKKALRAFFKPKGKIDKLREHTRKVSELESLIDGNERALTLQIFDSSLPLSEKLHLSRLLSSIVRISDVIEDAADELEFIGLKSIV